MMTMKIKGSFKAKKRYRLKLTIDNDGGFTLDSHRVLESVPSKVEYKRLELDDLAKLGFYFVLRDNINGKNEYVFCNDKTGDRLRCREDGYWRVETVGTEVSPELISAIKRANKVGIERFLGFK